MADYGALKWTDDPRWTNTRKRDAYKGLAEASHRDRDAEWLAGDVATAERLADAKKATAELYEAVGARDDVVGHLLPDQRIAERAAYCRMESAAAVERSLREKLVRGRYRLDKCRQRVASKTARLAWLRTTVHAARNPKPVRPPKRPAVLEPALLLDDKVDALKLGNLQAARARDIIADNSVMRNALNDQLAADVRRQAIAVVELLAYGTAAKQEAAAYRREYCRMAAEQEYRVRRNEAHKSFLDTRISTLESTRRKMIVNRIHNNSDEEIEFITGDAMSVAESELELRTSNKPDNINLTLLKDWIDIQMIEKQSSYTKESEQPSSTSNVTYPSDTITSNSYTFPEEKVNQYKFRKQKKSRAIEAVEYVCETLHFSNITEVLHYFTTVKNVEMRIKKMINIRKHLLEIAQESVASANEVMEESINCLPEAILQLDANIEYVQREGLDVQKKQFEDVNRDITGYGILFNELWFQLDSLVGKLERCHVPVVRKYQLHRKNRDMDSEPMMDAQQMLDGLCLQHLSVANDDCSTIRQTPTAKSIESTSETSNVFGRNPAVDACRKLSEVLYAKVKSCMVHVGSVFDSGDKKQLMARACFAYDRQTQIQWDVAATTDKKRRARDRLQLSVDNIKDSTTNAKTTGIMTRVQTKQQAQDIVQWCITPKDTDDAKRTRKPISFRKSRIVVRERKKF
ncbi:uncharacterized protein LOC132924824 [Rhopalosiphum padi]|uniref:uncharacterized protein LOC132924824 n=1 Tax=Rhopalosiphum padi TaxID=40932 RepID=UPI00298E20F4|nr:uncharacterized protein LOC132924824 [Rhopalosiphum padi]